MRQANYVRIQTLVFIQRLNGDSPPNSRTYDFAWKYAGLRSNHGAALHANVIAKADLSANHAIVFDRHAAADTGLRRDHNPLANVAVVADVDHVVDLSASANARAAQRRA